MKWFRVAVALLAVAPAFALAQLQPRPGANYSELNPAQRVEVPGKVEVLEFFWYGCIHCYNLEPALEAWLKKIPPDARFQRVPAVFNDRWARDAAIYYALEALDLVEKLHRPLFDAIHRDRLRTDNAEAFNQWLQKQGVEPKRFDDAVKSFGVQSKVRRAAQISVAYRIEGTPAIAVNGRYTVSAEQGGSQQGMLGITEYLIDLSRKDLKPAAQK
jgi:thiol:disulfide interchange protein DsbA